MSYMINDSPEQGRPSRRPVWWGLGILAVVALLVTTFLIGRGGRGGDGTAVLPPAVGDSITWTRVGPEPVPNSPLHGPRETSNGLAAGFSHDERGAVLAAINISTRLTGDAGPVVYETTAHQQCVGDVDATITAIRDQSSTAAAGTTVPTEYLYRVTGGTPAGDLVAVSIAASSPQSKSLGGFAELSRTLQWIDDDWKLQVPPSPPRLIPSVDGYVSLGRIDA